jgi:hypothetical protein
MLKSNFLRHLQIEALFEWERAATVGPSLDSIAISTIEPNINKCFSSELSMNTFPLVCKVRIKQEKHFRDIDRQQSS